MRWNGARLGGLFVQPEIETTRFSLVSVPPLRREFSTYRYDHEAIPQHGCVPAKPLSPSPRKIIVAPPRPADSTSALPVIHPGIRIDSLDFQSGRRSKREMVSESPSSERR